MAAPAASQPADLEPNVVYLTFNQPEKDEYHRGIFLTAGGPGERTELAGHSGTLFHAVFANGSWGLERRVVTNIGQSKSLVLMWKIGALQSGLSLDEIEEVLKRVPCRADMNAKEAAAAAASINGCNDSNNRIPFNNVQKGGFSCVPWTANALLALNKEGVIRVAKDIRATVTEARAQAGPEDAREMVGKDFGGLRIVNGTA